MSRSLGRALFLGLALALLLVGWVGLQPAGADPGLASAQTGMPLTPDATLAPPPEAPLWTPLWTPLPDTLDSSPADGQLAQSCCRVCRTGKACGDSCINRSRSCHRPPGCACDG